MGQYNCRNQQNNSMKLLAPGETRRNLLCPDCLSGPYRGPNCLFKTPGSNEGHNYHWQSANQQTYRSKHATHQEMLDAIKKRYHELGRLPFVSDLKPKYGTMSGYVIVTQFPGGFTEARLRAAEQLGIKVEFTCSRCGQSFPTVQGRNAHQFRCKQTQPAKVTIPKTKKGGR